MISIAVYNGRGGVDRVDVTYHLAHALARGGLTTVVVDADPQAWLTRRFLDEDALSTVWGESVPFPEFDPLSGMGAAGTVAMAARSVMDGPDTYELSSPVRIEPGLYLMPGDLALGAIEETLADAWRSAVDDADPVAIHTTSVFHQIVRDQAALVDADIVLIEIGANMDAVSRAALLAAMAWLVPANWESATAVGLRVLGPRVREWRARWRDVAPTTSDENADGRIEPVGYVIQRPLMLLGSPVNTYLRRISQLPELFAASILGDVTATSGYEVASLRNYHSLAREAVMAGKPIFDLRAADGVVGGIAELVRYCREDYQELAANLVTRVRGRFAGIPPVTMAKDWV